MMDGPGVRCAEEIDDMLSRFNTIGNATDRQNSNINIAIFAVLTCDKYPTNRTRPKLHFGVTRPLANTSTL